MQPRILLEEKVVPRLFALYSLRVIKGFSVCNTKSNHINQVSHLERERNYGKRIGKNVQPGGFGKPLI